LRTCSPTAKGVKDRTKNCSLWPLLALSENIFATAVIAIVHCEVDRPIDLDRAFADDVATEEENPFLMKRIEDSAICVTSACVRPSRDRKEFATIAAILLGSGRRVLDMEETREASGRVGYLDESNLDSAALLANERIRTYKV